MLPYTCVQILGSQNPFVFEMTIAAQNSDVWLEIPPWSGQILQDITVLYTYFTCDEVWALVRRWRHSYFWSAFCVVDYRNLQYIYTGQSNAIQNLFTEYIFISPTTPDIDFIQIPIIGRFYVWSFVLVMAHPQVCYFISVGILFLPKKFHFKYAHMHSAHNFLFKYCW